MAANPVSVVLFGTGSVFSAAVFQQLMAVPSLVRVQAVVAARGGPVSPPLPAPVPAPAGEALPVSVAGRPDSMATLARSQGIPVVETRTPADPAIEACVSGLRPDYILVACFPHRVSEPVCSQAASGSLNLHPSLLPRYRGPQPVFWQRYYGETDIGITLHHLSEQYDAGDIVAQSRCRLADGMDAAAIDEATGRAGGRLFVDVIAANAGGLSSRRAQDEHASSYFHAPASDDLRLSNQWSARRLFNFICAAGAWQQQLSIRIGAQVWRVEQVLGYDADARLDAELQPSDTYTLVQCHPGVLRVRLSRQQ